MLLGSRARVKALGVIALAAPTSPAYFSFIISSSSGENWSTENDIVGITVWNPTVIARTDTPTIALDIPVSPALQWLNVVIHQGNDNTRQYVPFALVEGEV